MRRMVSYIIIINVILVWLIMGCQSREPFEYHPENESKSGPGLFSGEDGSFNLYSKPEEEGEPEIIEDSEGTN